jgi:nicotinamidase/pyrazinamidase
MKKLLAVLVIIILSVGLYIFIGYQKMNAVTKGDKIAEYQNPKNALLIIDLQRDITEKNGRMVMNVEQTDQCIKNINKILADNSRLDLVVIYITQEFENNFIVKLLTKNALQHGDTGAEIDPRIKIISANHFIKHASDSFSNPGLDAFLIKNKVNHVYITGVDAEYCVDKTIKGALNRNYKVTVIRDAIGSGTDEKRDNKISEFTKLGARVVSTDQMLKGI